MPDHKTALDLDRILAIVRDEAKRRGASGRAGVPAAEKGVCGGAIARRPALHDEPQHVRDFLALSTEQMLDVAYRRLLRRPPDPAGLDNYRRSLRTLRRTKIEVLGLIRFSAEGRRQQSRLPGLIPACVMAIVYRIPVAGWLAELTSRVLRLPAHLQCRRYAEQVAQETSAELEG